MSVQHAAVVAFGTPASGFIDCERRVVHFHGFKALTRTRGEFVRSPEFACFGRQWLLEIFPGGHETSNAGMVAAFLWNMTDNDIELDCYGFSVKDSDGDDVADFRSRCYGSCLFEALDSSGESGRGFQNFAKRSKLLRALVAGTLIIEVRMRRAGSSVDLHPFVGENPSRDMVLKLFADDKTADILFEVGEDGQQRPDSKKRSRTDPVEFHAHRFVLNQSAPMLAALCPPGDGVVSVPITDMAPETFRPLLFYLYGGDVSKEDYKSHAKNIIKAADRFEIVGLKLAAEAWYVRSTKIDLDNVMELLLYSDAKNLALLKEAVMDFILANRNDVLEKVPLNEVPGGLFADLLAATGRGVENNGGNTTNADFSSMRISDLRRKVHEKGLNIDGSREMLIAALKQSN